MRDKTMVQVVVTGISIASALGTKAQAWQALQLGQSAINFQQPFTDCPQIPLALIARQPSDLERLRAKLVSDVVADTQFEGSFEDCAVIIGSSRGFQGKMEALATAYYQQHDLDFSHWTKLMPNNLAIDTAQQLGSTGPAIAPMGACTTGLWAICLGYNFLQQGQYKRVLVGAVESPVTRLCLTGFRRMGALAQTGCFPFDQAREGLVLGEGGAFLMLEALPQARSREARIYGEILGWSFTCDAHHVSAPQASHQSARRAIAQCLFRSGLTSEDIDHIHPHGTSTRLNDQAEAEIIQQLFPHGPWVSGSKGATGHTLGGSGALSVAFSLLMLQRQRIFPCVGLSNPAFDLDFATAAITQPLEHALCLSFGFGGQNGAIALRKY